LITSHFGNRVVAAARELTTASTRPLFFVQPLPDDRVLTAAARTKGEANGHVWDGAGSLVCQADLGDAIEDAISDEAGEVWVGYFDEALGSPPPAGHRLARFSSDLVLDWMYPSPGSTSLPPVDDCYALNVVARSAYCCPYSDFQLLRVHGSAVENYGPMPYRGAHALLIDGSIGAMVGGYGPDYDLVSPFRIAASGIEHHLSPLRLVLPDGLEVRDRRIFCRGAQLHVFVRSGWYRLDLDDFLRAAT
jgi:hypothetical protein